MQTATIVFALPFIVVIVLMAVSLWRAIRTDWREQQREERELHATDEGDGGEEVAGFAVVGSVTAVQRTVPSPSW